MIKFTWLNYITIWKEKELLHRRDLTNKIVQDQWISKNHKIKVFWEYHEIKKPIKSKIFFSNLLALSEYINFTNTHKNY